MRLLVDLGGTRLKWSLLADGELTPMDSAHWRERGMPATLEAVWASLPRPEEVLVASVSEAEATRAVELWCERHWALSPAAVKVAMQAAGVRNRYAQPERLGVDRWLAAIGAYHRCGSAVCVVDAGTGVTVDAVSPEGEYLGGVIAPGFALMRQALSLRTRAAVPSDTGARGVFGKTTADCVSAGCALAVAGLVERALEEVRGGLGAGTPCVLTGGDAEHLRPLLRTTVDHVPDLVLRGMALVAKEP